MTRVGSAHADGSGRREAILIAGATASGKSALALRLAARLGGRIVNADSMQVYRDLVIITARPREAEMRQASHRLYGTVDGADAFSVSRWLTAVTAELAAARNDGAMPIIVGGTGLYFKALTQGLSDLPTIPADVRAQLRTWAADQPPETLHRELARRDPATAARLLPTDPQRILRAIEVHEATGESLATLQGRRRCACLDPASCVAVTLQVDREVLRARVDARFDGMIAAGALDEVDRLTARRLDPALPVMRAIGVPQLARHLAGQMPSETAIAEAKTATRRYIKRQETFFRHQLHGFRAATSDEAEALVLA